MFKEKNVANKVDGSSLTVPWQNGKYKIHTHKYVSYAEEITQYENNG